MVAIAQEKKLLVCILALLALSATLPGNQQRWTLKDGALTRLDGYHAGVQIDAPGQADLNGDGSPESLSLAGGQAEIRSGGEAVWRSPEGWQVAQAEIADLNRDGAPEAALLVWRAFQPWPVDRVLPHGGRIAGFHDAEGRSCHLILIGWMRGVYREVWAGSALADPLLRFAAADLDGDGLQELAALEGDYDGVRRALTAWEWNGFGFTLIDRVEGPFRSMRLLAGEDQQIYINVRN